MSYETEAFFKKTHFDIQTRRRLAGLTGIKASGEENTVRGAVQTTLGHVLQVPAAQGPGATPLRAAVGARSHSGRCHCYDYKGLQEALLGQSRSWTLPLLLAVGLGEGPQ